MNVNLLDVRKRVLLEYFELGNDTVRSEFHVDWDGKCVEFKKKLAAMGFEPMPPKRLVP